MHSFEHFYLFNSKLLIVDYTIMSVKKDWTGQKFGKLVFKNPTGEKQGHHLLWNLSCDCGGNVNAIPCNVSSGKIKSCGCLRSAAAREAARSGIKGRRYAPIISSARTVWFGTYSSELEFEMFYKLSQLPCHYCGRPPYRIFNVASMTSNHYNSDNQKNNGNFIYNGLDRVDSSLGHTLDNIVPCCYECNRAKSNMTVDSFLELIKLIYQHSINVYQT